VPDTGRYAKQLSGVYDGSDIRGGQDYGQTSAEFRDFYET